MTVIQCAAFEYVIGIDEAGPSTQEAQLLRQQWSRTITPLWDTHRLLITKVTWENWSNGLSKALDVYVDAMLHELGYKTCEVAAYRGHERCVGKNNVVFKAKCYQLRRFLCPKPLIDAVRQRIEHILNPSRAYLKG
jgi:hypothetical protein